MRPGGEAGQLFQNLPLPSRRPSSVDMERGVTHPPALAPRSKAAVQAYNKVQADADARAEARDRVSEMYQGMADRQRKDELRIAREKKDRKETGAAMTPEQWALLTPLQQAAVQANADLAGAIQRDFKDQTKHHASTEQIQTYMDQVKNMFGEDGSVGYKGMEFAPNTLAFLNERGLDKNDLGGRTLDDLVSGDTLFTQEEVDALGKPVAKGGPDVFKVPDSGRIFVEKIARGQLQYQEDIAAKLARGNQILTDVTGRETNSAAGEAFGAVQDQRAPLDAVQPQTLQQIDLYMEALARPDSPIDQALDAINLDLMQRGVSTKEADQVWAELSNRSRQGVTGEGKWFDGLDFPMRSPVEVAQALGAPTLKRRNVGSEG
jgi:hypothetical protein